MLRATLLAALLTLATHVALADEPAHKPPLQIKASLIIDTVAHRRLVKITLTNIGKVPLRVIRPKSALARLGGRLFGWTLVLEGPAGAYGLPKAPAPVQMLQAKDVVLLAAGASLEGTIDVSEARAAKGQVFGEDKGAYQVTVTFSATKSTYMRNWDKTCFLGERKRVAKAKLP